MLDEGLLVVDEVDEGQTLDKRCLFKAGSVEYTLSETMDSGSEEVVYILVVG